MRDQPTRDSRPPLVIIALLLLLPWLLWAAVGDCAWATPRQSPLNQTVPPRKPTPHVVPVEPTAVHGDETGAGEAAPIPGMAPALPAEQSARGDASAAPEEEPIPAPIEGSVSAHADEVSPPDQNTPVLDESLAPGEEPVVFLTPLRPADRQASAESTSVVGGHIGRTTRAITATQLGMCVIPVAGILLLLSGAVLWLRAGGR